MAKTGKGNSDKPKSPKQGHRVPLLCPRCPKVINQLTQHLRDKHGLRTEAAKTERDTAYRKLLRNIRNFSVLEEENIREMMNNDKIDYDGVRRLLVRCGHLIVAKADKKKGKKTDDAHKVNVFDEFPCDIDEPVPSRKRMEKAFGEEVDAKSLSNRWIFKQYSLRAADVVENFPRKRPNKKQIEQYFEEKQWNLGKTQMDVVNRVLWREWNQAGMKREQPDDNATVMKNIEEQKWALSIMHNLEGRGSGVFSTRAFAKDQVVCDYQGAVTTNLSAKQVEDEIAKKGSSIYCMQVLHNSRYVLIDASEDDGKVGRMVNHSSRHNNVRPQRRILEGSLHILLVAKDDIQAGKEILFNYGDKDSDLPECVPGCVSCIKEGRPVVIERESTEAGNNESGPMKMEEDTLTGENNQASESDGEHTTKKQAQDDGSHNTATADAKPERKMGANKCKQKPVKRLDAAECKKKVYED